MSATRPLIAVIGAGRADPEAYAHARTVGQAVGRAGAGVVCGGLGGVMEGACRGALDVWGRGSGATVGILPGRDPAAANPWVEVAVATGMGTSRNVAVVLSGRAVVIVGGEAGTLSEVGHAWQLGRPLAAWTPAGGWGARVAGSLVDGRRDDPVAPLESVEELQAWLESVLDG